MKANVAVASTLDNLEVGRWGDLTRYLAKKNVADLAVDKRIAHTMQVVDVETLMRQFEQAIVRLDTLVRKTPNGEETTVKKMTSEIKQMKKDLSNDLYCSLKRLQKESSYLSIATTHPMIGGPRAWTGKITIPALCGVLANTLEAAPEAARVKRALIIEHLLKSLSFLDEIPEVARTGLNLREMLKLALHAEQADNLPRGLRSLASKLILHYPGAQIESRANKTAAENHILLVDLKTAHWTKYWEKKVGWNRIDFSLQQMNRVAASEFADPLMELFRKRFGIKTVLEISGIKSDRKLKNSAIDTVIGSEKIWNILQDTNSIVQTSNKKRTMENALEATLWNSLYELYKGISTDSHSSIRNLQIMGDGSGRLRVWHHIFLDTDILQKAREGQDMAKFLLQEKGQEFAASILLLGNPEAMKWTTAIDWRKLFPESAIKAPWVSALGYKKYRPQRLYGFLRAFGEYYGSPFHPTMPNKLQKWSFEDYSDIKFYANSQVLPERVRMRSLGGRGNVFPTDEAMRQILDGLGYYKAKTTKRPPTSKYRITESASIEQAARDKRVCFRIIGQKIPFDLSEVKRNVKQTRDPNGITWSMHFHKQMEKIKKLPLDSSSFLIGEMLDSMRYWYKRMCLDSIPLDDEDFFLFFADVAMRHGLTGNLASFSDEASLLGRCLDDPDMMLIDKYRISNLLPGSMRWALDHLEIRYNPKTNLAIILAIQDKLVREAERLHDSKLAKDLHVITNFIEGLFNQITSKETMKRWGGKKGIFHNLTPRDEVKLQSIIELIQKRTADVEIFGVHRLISVEIENADTIPEYFFNVGVNILRPKQFSTYVAINRLRKSEVGPNVKAFGEQLRRAVKLMIEIQSDNADFFRSRMLWGVNSESLTRTEIDEIYSILQKNVTELMASETGVWTNDFIFEKEVFEALDGDYKKIGDLYSILESLNDLRSISQPKILSWWDDA
ncbi:MAG: hypothetical protein ACE5OZ_09635 [Candidatus Heimdallarchaeota archaeon]